MKKKDSKLILYIVVAVTTVVSLILSSAIFNSPKKHNLSVPIVEQINSTFPDVRNDTNYNTFLNDKALDVTQPVQVGNTQNTTPFNQ